MKQIVDSRQMKELDRYTIEEMGVSSIVLMERAALAVVEELKDSFDTKKILVVCGSGNNGGDGVAIARILHVQGYSVDIFMAGKKEAFTEETRIQWKIAGNYGNSLVNNPVFSEYTTIVDAVFGIGLSREVTGIYGELFRKINESNVPVLSVDIPSGIHGTTGQVMGIGIRANTTVTFAYGKTGLYLYPGAEYAGNIVVKDIGICKEEKEALFALEESEYHWLKKRTPGGNKGTFGKVLIVAGSKDMCGAAYFAGKAALFSGAGMVKIFTAECNRMILQQLLPEALLTTYESTQSKSEVTEKLKKAREWADVEAVGPGLGNSVQAEWLMEELLKESEENAVQKPLVIDADGLNWLSRHRELLRSIKRPCILTPHMGEMTRLSGYSMEVLKEDPVQYLKKFRQIYPVTVILKDARTLTGCSDDSYYLNLTGNSGMATAGSGDVLTGIVAGILAQSVVPEKAAPLAVWLHGKAGDEAKKKKGERSMVASDLLEGLAVVLAQWENIRENKKRQ